MALAHLIVLWFVAGERVLPERPYVPPPNFGYAEGEIVDDTTGERLVVKQFTVSTKLVELDKEITNENVDEAVNLAHRDDAYLPTPETNKSDE